MANNGFLKELSPHAVTTDSTDEMVLNSLGIRNFDVVVIREGDVLVVIGANADLVELEEQA
jgi:Trk K+ transport system NAD-binding subunit